MTIYRNALLIACLAIVGCEPENPPYTVLPHLRVYYPRGEQTMLFTAQDDNVIIKGLTLNKGHCKATVSFPVTLQYYEETKVETDCITIHEAVIETNRGTWNHRWTML